MRMSRLTHEVGIAWQPHRRRVRQIPRYDHSTSCYYIVFCHSGRDSAAINRDSILPDTDYSSPEKSAFVESYYAADQPFVFRRAPKTQDEQLAEQEAHYELITEMTAKKYEDEISEQNTDWMFSQNESDLVVELDEKKFLESISGYEKAIFDVTEGSVALFAGERTLSNSWNANMTEKEVDWELLDERTYENVGRPFSVSAVSPRAMADLLFHTYESETTWLETFSEQWNRRLPSISLARTLQVWNLNEDEAAEIFGVRSRTVKQWLDQGIPSEMEQRLSDIAAATDLLIHYLKRDRIPAVVRRPIDSLGGRSLMTLLSDRDTRGVLETCRNMFEFERANG